MEHYAAVKERLVAGVQTDGTAIVGVDDDWCAAVGRPRSSSAGKRVVRDLGAPAAAPTASMSTASRSCSAAGGTAHADRAISAASARCAARTTRRTRPAPRPRRSRSASTPRRSSRACARFPGLAHRMEQVGRKRPRAVRQRFQGDQRRFRGAGAGLLRRHLLDRRRQAEDRRHRDRSPNSSRASARPI